MNRQEGQALPVAIMALAAGALVVSPFLSHASTNLLSSRFYDSVIMEQNAADAGVEHGIWSLVNGGLGEALTEPGDQAFYDIGPINGLTADVTITANVTATEGSLGEIGDTAIDALEFENDDGCEPDIIHISGDIYAIAYSGEGSDGYLKTVSIADNGNIADTVIDTQMFDSSRSYGPDIIHVTGDVYVIAYRGNNNDGYLKTVSITADGDIGHWPIDALEFDHSNGYEPDIVHVSGNVYALAYRGSNNDGYLKTVSINTNGDIGNFAIDALEFDHSNGYEPDIVHVSGNVYAIAYRGSNNDGYLKTVSIDSNGDIWHWAIDTLEFDAASGYEPEIVHVSNDVFAIAYRGAGNDGHLTTVSINANGYINNSAIDTLEFDTSASYEPDTIQASGSVFAIAYRGAGNDGYFKTVAVAPDGNIGDTAIDTLVFDTSAGYEPSIIPISGDTYAIAYRGQNNDGFVKTIEISTQGGSPSADYEILSQAGDAVIRAFININGGDVTVLSWLAE